MHIASLNTVTAVAKPRSTFLALACAIVITSVFAVADTNNSYNHMHKCLINQLNWH
jgi:hypothetical protein